MRTSTFAAAAALFALAACGGSDQKATGNSAASPTSPGSASASGGTASGAGAKLSPGLYETTAEMKIAGLPPEMAKAMEGAQQEKHKQCITPEEAAKGSGELFSGKDENCRQKDVVFAGGRIHGTLVCPGKTGGSDGTMMTIDGSYTSTSYDVASHMVVQSEGKPMTMDAHMVGRRVGECKGGEDE